VVLTNVIALICVAMTERPTAHHGISRPARKKSSIRALRRPAHAPMRRMPTK
jgi:hypothetical protein